MNIHRADISNEHWSVLEPILQGLTSRGPKGRNDRRFINAVAWIVRTGAPWRDLPQAYGKWTTVYRRFRRWAVSGRWDALHYAVHASSNDDVWLIDSTIVKAHLHAAGALRRSGAQALGRSRGGFTTKVHAIVTAQGRLIRYTLTGGQVHDITQATSLIAQGGAVSLIGDRAYDCDAFVTHIEAIGITPVIPSRAGRRKARRLNRTSYRLRNLIERFFGRLKQYRRIATRYDKTALSFAAQLLLAATLVSLSGWPCR